MNSSLLDRIERYARTAQSTIETISDIGVGAAAVASVAAPATAGTAPHESPGIDAIDPAPKTQAKDFSFSAAAGKHPLPRGVKQPGDFCGTEPGFKMPKPEEFLPFVPPLGPFIDGPMDPALWLNPPCGQGNGPLHPGTLRPPQYPTAEPRHVRTDEERAKNVKVVGALVGGMTAGAQIGAGLGTAVPGVGNVAGAVVGAAAGAIVGLIGAFFIANN